jgi:hypothetical protein
MGRDNSVLYYTSGKYKEYLSLAAYKSEVWERLQNPKFTFLLHPVIPYKKK